MRIHGLEKRAIWRGGGGGVSFPGLHGIGHLAKRGDRLLFLRITPRRDGHDTI